MLLGHHSVNAAGAVSGTLETVVTGDREVVAARVQPSWRFRSGQCLLPQGHLYPGAYTCGFSGSVGVRLDFGFSSSTLNSRFVKISSAICNLGLWEHNLPGGSKLGMCQGLESRAL